MKAPPAFPEIFLILRAGAVGLLGLWVLPFAVGSSTNGSNASLAEIQTNSPALYAAIMAGQQTSWKSGYLNVTQPPYRVSVSAQDNAPAINAAARDGFYNNLTVFFPSGTYPVQHQISCAFPPPRSLEGNLKYCDILVGPSAPGAGRAVLRYTGSGTDSPLVYFQYLDSKSGQPDGTRQYGSTFRNIDIDMGSHPSCDALSMAGAQDCDIEDVTISGADFHAGVHGLPGSGGSINHLTVNGGRIGVLSSSYRPNPTVVGLTLTGQSECGVSIESSRGPVCLIGFHISNLSGSSKYAAIASEVKNAWRTHPEGDICLVDGTITVPGSATVAIRNGGGNSNIAIRNVYIEAGNLIKSGPGKGISLSGNGSGYLWLRDYAYAASDGRAVIYQNDGAGSVIDHRAPSGPGAAGSPAVPQDPSPGLIADLVDRHVCAVPISWQDSSAHLFSVTNPPAGLPAAHPDALGSDDALAINQIIDYAAKQPGAATVFLPRGLYHIQSSILLKDGVNLIGAGKNISTLQVVPGPGWLAAANQPSLLGVSPPTAGNAARGVVLQDFLLMGLSASSANDPLAPRYLSKISLLDVRNPATVLRDVDVTGRGGRQIQGEGEKLAAYAARPIVTMEDQAGGHFYDLSLYTFSPREAAPDADYHLVQIRQTEHPLYFYSASMEHQRVGGAEVQIDHAQNVHFLGFKAEGSHELVQVNDSINCSVFGCSGNLSPAPASEGTPLIAITGASDRLWFCLLDREIKKEKESDGNWITWDTNPPVSIPGDAPVALFRLGPPVILAPGFTETFVGQSTHFALAPGYVAGRDAAGRTCLNFTGGPFPAPLYCRQSLIQTAKEFQVSVALKMSFAPALLSDTPALIFAHGSLGDYAVRIRPNKNLWITGPDIPGRIEIPVSSYLNRAVGNSLMNWNRLTVDVNGGAFTIFVNETKVLSLTKPDLVAMTKNPALLMSFGLIGSSRSPCSFQDFWFYQVP